jgi:hypothetical protein
MVFWYGPVQSDKRLDRAVQSFQQSPKKATVWTGPDRGQSTHISIVLQLTGFSQHLTVTLIP